MGLHSVETALKFKLPSIKYSRHVLIPVIFAGLGSVMITFACRKFGWKIRSIKHAKDISRGRSLAENANDGTYCKANGIVQCSTPFKDEHLPGMTSNQCSFVIRKMWEKTSEENDHFLETSFYDKEPSVKSHRKHLMQEVIECVPFDLKLEDGSTILVQPEGAFLDLQATYDSRQIKEFVLCNESQAFIVGRLISQGNAVKTKRSISMQSSGNDSLQNVPMYKINRGHFFLISWKNERRILNELRLKFYLFSASGVICYLLSGAIYLKLDLSVHSFNIFGGF